MKAKEKVFYICDDNSENLFVGKIKRTNDQLKKDVAELNIGDIYSLSKTVYLINFFRAKQKSLI